MSNKQKKPLREKTENESRRKTPTFLLELSLRVNEGQAKRIRGHLEAGRQLYNAVLSEGQRRMRCMRADPARPSGSCPSPHTEASASEGLLRVETTV